MGLLDNNNFTSIPQDQRQNLTDSEFSPIYQSFVAQYSQQNPVDRMSLAAAQRQQLGHLRSLADKNFNTNLYQNSSENTEGTDYSTKPTSSNPLEQKYIDDEWNKMWSTQVQLDDDKGKSSTFSIQPFSNMSYGTEPINNQDFYEQAKKAYNQYGPDILNYIFK